MTSAGSAGRPAADAAAYRAIEHIYHSYLTGLILMLASRAGPQRAADVVFRTFRRQQLARFLPGLKKLGLDNLPHGSPVRNIAIFQTSRRRESRIRLRKRSEGLGAISTAVLDLVGDRDLRHFFRCISGDAAGV